MSTQELNEELQRKLHEVNVLKAKMVSWMGFKNLCTNRVYHLAKRKRARPVHNGFTGTELYRSEIRGKHDSVLALAEAVLDCAVHWAALAILRWACTGAGPALALGCAGREPR